MDKKYGIPDTDIFLQKIIKIESVSCEIALSMYCSIYYYLNTFLSPEKSK